VSGLDKSLAFPLLVSNASSFLLAQADSSGPAVEPFDSAESDIAPRPIPTFSSAAQAAEGSVGTSERWPWLVGLCLVVLGAEWVVFARRG
jgi:hypothetical protein